MVTRRQFIRAGTRAAGAFAFWQGLGAWAATTGPDVCVARGGKVAERLWAAIEAMGGIGAYVKPGSRVVIKPNAAFSEPPESGGTVTPEAMGALVSFVRGAGAGSILVLDHCCSNRGMFGTDKDPTGITQAAVGERVAFLDPGRDAANYIERPLNGAPVKSVLVSRALLEADCVINLARLKNHPRCGYTMTLKNMMGVMRDMSAFHGDLPACLGALAELTQPSVHLCVIDGAHLVTEWEAGRPGKLQQLDTIIAGRSMVCTDAVGVSLYDVNPLDTYLSIPHRRGVGIAKLQDLRIQRVDG